MLLQMALFHSFLWLSPSYTYHIIFIHSSVEGHLGCFHFLTIVISAVMNIGVHVSFLIKIFIFLDICPGVKLLDYMLLLLCSHSVVSDSLQAHGLQYTRLPWPSPSPRGSYVGTCMLFSTVAGQIYISTNGVERFFFIHTLSSIYYLQDFKHLFFLKILIVVKDM